MCGIAGIISTNPNNISNARLKNMADAIAHRGPDGEGFWINGNGKVGFGHRRLAIIDLSEQAAQPMQYANRYSVVYNGEIYNYIEVKKDLQAKGYEFRSSSDTEVILAAYDCYQDECLQYFDGMYALAIWDEKEQTLFCVRDRFGEKPFYYSFTESEFIFGSEAKTLWAAGVEKKVNNPLLLNYLALGHSQTPVDKTITFYQDIFSLPSAHYLKLQLHTFTFDLVSYWDCNKEKQIDIPEKDAVEKLQQLFELSIKRRLRSDVSIGTSLSGGLDSSSIVASIVHENQSCFSQKTFSAVFPDYEKDESAYIDIVTKKFNLENYKVSPNADNLISDFDTLCYHQEMPFPSSSIYAQFKVFESAKQHQIKVLLDGQGADEVFAGYAKYIYWYLQELFRKKIGAAIKEKNALKRNSISFDWGWKNYLAAFYPAEAANQLEKREAKKILHDRNIAEEFKQSYFDRPTIYKPLVTKLNDILYFNTFQSGLDELLRFADRNSMAHGAEVRLPFLSHELVEFVFSLPPDLKIHEGWTKYILRKSMANKLPTEIVWRKDKIGYEPPQKKWMQDKNLQDYIHEAKKTLIDKKILRHDILNKKNQPLDANAADNFDWRYLVAAKCIG